MKCGFCGQKLKEQDEKKTLCSKESFENKLLYQYLQCEQDLVINEPILIKRVGQIQKLVHNQLKSDINLDQYFIEQFSDLDKKINIFFSQQKDIFIDKQKTIIEFDKNFKKVSLIQFNQQFQKLIPNHVTDYFEEDKLKNWVQINQNKLTCLQEKIDYVQQNLKTKIENFLKDIKNYQGIQKESIQLHDMSFTVLQKQTETDQNILENQLQTLEQFYKESWKTNTLCIIEKFEQYKQNFQKINHEFKRHKILLKDLIKNFLKDFRVIEIFKDLETTIKSCFQEIENRHRFRMILKNILDVISLLISKENTRRFQFLKQYSSQIPNQLFPNLKNLCKNLNLQKFYIAIDDQDTLDLKDIQLDNTLEKLKQQYLSL